MSTTFRDSYGAAKYLTQDPQPPTGAVKITQSVPPTSSGGKQAEGGHGRRRMMMEAELLRRAVCVMKAVVLLTSQLQTKF